jgi:hypothetical protein
MRGYQLKRSINTPAVKPTPVEPKSKEDFLIKEKEQPRRILRISRYLYWKYRNLSWRNIVFYD